MIKIIKKGASSRGGIMGGKFSPRKRRNPWERQTDRVE